LTFPVSRWCCSHRKKWYATGKKLSSCCGAVGSTVSRADLERHRIEVEREIAVVAEQHAAPVSGPHLDTAAAIAQLRAE
jgi:hypothetical protein